MDKVKIIHGQPFVPYRSTSYTPEIMLKKSVGVYQWADQRRSLREFSSGSVPRQVTIIQTATKAPSGAHKQPRTFCAVTDTRLKSKIRKSAEAEE